MISITTPLHATELVELANEIATIDGLTMPEAFALACEQLPSLLADIDEGARFIPCKVVMFDGDGRPVRVPNLLTAEELWRFTGGGHATRE